MNISAATKSNVKGQVLSVSNSSKGFTLLELLIVITIIAVLSVILIVALNPAETLKKARDTQRLSDLASLKTAIGIFTTTVNMTSANDLDFTSTTGCLGRPTSAGADTTTAQVYYSYAQTDKTCAIDVAEGDDRTGSSTFGGGATDMCTYVAVPNGGVNGGGWIPVNFTAITGGSPISNLPVDPSNVVPSGTAGNAPVSTDLVYRYACQNAVGDSKPSYVFELNAVLESQAFATTELRMTNDGGDNTAYYEVGTSLRLLGSGTNY